MAADWLIRLLGTPDADAKFTVAIWGLSVDQEVQLAENVRLMPFATLPDSPLKKRISERAATLWNDVVWVSQRRFDLPGAAIIWKVANFPYIRTDDASFQAMAELESAAQEAAIFLQGRIAGQPLAFGYWFEYEDRDLDLNAYENYISWILPEVVPMVRAAPPMELDTVRRRFNALSAVQIDWRTDLRRSMERFISSQCRHQMIDRILDLTLAFEIAVSGDGNQAPLSWKVAVRSAQMLGGSLQERLEHRGKLSELYKLRNKGTHGSSLSSVTLQKQQTILAEASKLYRDLLERLWCQGMRPNWSAIELEPSLPSPVSKLDE